jgi:thioredoxin 1
MLRLINKHKWLLAMFAVVMVILAGCSYHEKPNLLAPALASGKPTIVEFGRGICEPCKQMRPILEGLAADLQGKLNVVIVDIDEFPLLTDEYGVMTIPAQIIFDSSGSKVASHLGFWPKETILTQLKAVGIE